MFDLTVKDLQTIHPLFADDVTLVRVCVCVYVCVTVRVRVQTCPKCCIPHAVRIADENAEPLVLYASCPGHRAAIAAQRCAASRVVPSSLRAHTHMHRGTHTHARARAHTHVWDFNRLGNHMRHA